MPDKRLLFLQRCDDEMATLYQCIVHVVIILPGNLYNKMLCVCFLFLFTWVKVNCKTDFF